MKVLIVCGGKKPSKEILKQYINDDTYIICADSGANCLYEYEITPNMLLGDFDSIKEEVLSYYISKDIETCKFPAEKNFTDTEAALSEAILKKPKEIFFFGATGSRLDHLLANIGLLYKCFQSGIKGHIIDDNNEVTIYDRAFYIEGKEGQLFSLVAFGAEVKALNIEGAKYPLKNYNLSFGDPRTVSNEIAKSKVHITFDSGVIILIKSKD